MRLTGIFLVACVVLAAAQAMAAVLMVLLLIGFAFSLFVAPKETLGFVAILLVAGMWQASPIFFLALISLLVLARRIQR